LNKRFNFDLIPVYNENETNDGLKLNGEIKFCKPPYSQKIKKEEFIKKAVEEMKRKVSVFLIPVSTSTNYFTNG
jgi:hypothetical protein